MYYTVSAQTPAPAPAPGPGLVSAVPLAQPQLVYAAGYPAQPMAGYPAQSAAQPVAQPMAQPMAGYPAQPMAGYPAQPMAGYPAFAGALPAQPTMNITLSMPSGSLIVDNIVEGVMFDLTFAANPNPNPNSNPNSILIQYNR